jgi:hypothetical protein
MRPPALRRKIPLESEIQSSILDYLMFRKHFVLRLNNIPAFNRNTDGSIRMRRLPKGAVRGMADIIVVHVGKPYFLEVKRPGSYQRPEQREFQKHAESVGALYAVVRSIEEVQRLGL